MQKTTYRVARDAQLTGPAGGWDPPLGSARRTNEKPLNLKPTGSGPPVRHTHTHPRFTHPGRLEPGRLARAWGVGLQISPERGHHPVSD